MEHPNVELLRRAWAAYDRGDVEAFSACLTDDWRESDSGSDEYATLDDERPTMALHRTAFPDKHTEIHHIVADGQATRHPRDDVQRCARWSPCRDLGDHG